MKKYLIAMLILINNQAFSDCRDLLQNNHDSQAYSFSSDTNLHLQSKDLEVLIEDIKLTMRKVGCSEDEIDKVKVRNKSCKYLIPNIPYSYSCYISIEQGYFFVSQDMLLNLNIIFNRWD